MELLQGMNNWFCYIVNDFPGTLTSVSLYEGERDLELIDETYCLDHSRTDFYLTLTVVKAFLNP